MGGQEFEHEELLATRARRKHIEQGLVERRIFLVLIVLVTLTLLVVTVVGLFSRWPPESIGATGLGSLFASLLLGLGRGDEKHRA